MADTKFHIMEYIETDILFTNLWYIIRNHHGNNDKKQLKNTKAHVSEAEVTYLYMSNGS